MRKSLSRFHDSLFPMCSGGSGWVGGGAGGDGDDDVTHAYTQHTAYDLYIYFVFTQKNTTSLIMGAWQERARARTHRHFCPQHKTIKMSEP